MECWVCFFNGNGYNTYFQKDFSTDSGYVAGTRRKVSYTFTAINDGVDGTGPGQHIYLYRTRGTKPDHTYVVGFYNQQLFDLTEMYGEGFEPSQEMCDAIYTAGWWEYRA